MLKHFQIWLRVCGDIHIENSNLGLDNQLDLDSSSWAMFSHIPFMDWQSQRVCYFFVYIMLWIYFCCKYILWSFVWTLPKDLPPVVFHKFSISQHPALQQCSISRRWARGFTVTRWPAKQEERGQQLIVKKCTGYRYQFLFSLPAWVYNLHLYNVYLNFSTSIQFAQLITIDYFRLLKLSRLKSSPSIISFR